MPQTSSEICIFPQVIFFHIALPGKIIENIPKEDSDAIKKMNIPKRLMYTKITTMKQDLPMVVLMCIWEGLTTVLKKAGVKYRLEEDAKKIDIKILEENLRRENVRLMGILSRTV